MRTKTKISLGVGLLFLLILVLAVVGTVFINALSNDTQEILTDNYISLDYSRQMLIALDEMPTDRAGAIAKFAENLQKQQANITEVGELEATKALGEGFARLLANPADTSLPAALRTDLNEIMRLNMDAIVRKSETAKKTAENATAWIAITGTLCFLIAFSLLVNLPGSIANPIRELTESIRQIAAKNYHQRVNFEAHNEFGELARAFNSMAQKLEEYDNSTLASLLTEKKRIETLVNKMHDPVIGLDADRKIIFANEEALKILGVTAADIIGQPAQEIAAHNDLLHALLRDLHHPTPSNGHKTTAPLRIFADGKESFFEKETIEISITPTGERTQRLLGHVVLLRNVTVFKELDFAKTNFIATISHELKTPISSIKMSLQLLENPQTGSLNTEQTQLAHSIRDDADRVLKITGELLNMAQAETGNIQLNILPSDPQIILQLALNTVRTQAEQKKIQVEVYTDPALPTVRSDTDKTVWVLVNLLTNAITYSPEQSAIQVELKKDGENAVLFSVRDFGKGIDARYRSRVFDRYFQVPGSAKTGTGLGLAISKEFIEAQGGSIGVESELGMGSRFFFRLGA